MSDDMEWDDAAIETLRALWGEGLSAGEIGRRMRISKNAVVGKKNRLGLAARPSPIRRDGLGATRATRVRAASRPVALPVLATASLPVIAAPPAPVRLPPPVRLGLRAVPGARVTPCCWPIGEPGVKGFRFCDADAVAGRSYCEAHAALAYTAAPVRRADRVAY